MFAYCLNNPVNASDPFGNMPNSQKTQAMALVDEYGGGGGGILPLGIMGTVASSIILLGPMMDDLINAISSAIDQTYKEVYEFSQNVRAEFVEAKRKMPQVHHIVPVGEFTSRSAKIYIMIEELHDILENAEINVRYDPINLMLVSSGTHASLHTDAYIMLVYSYIKPVAGNKEAICGALFALRIYIAGKDIYASGY